MKFSTIVKYESSYHILPGATFRAYNLGKPTLPVQIAAPSVYSEGQLVACGGQVNVSNDLLLSPSVRIFQDPNAITLLHAALRLGRHPTLVPESEAARCEIQTHAHAVWIPLEDCVGFSQPNRHVLFDVPADSPLKQQILMPGLAVLKEGERLSVRVVRSEKSSNGLFKGSEMVPVTLEQFTVLYDGTNLNLEGAQIERPLSEGFV